MIVSRARRPPPYVRRKSVVTGTDVFSTLVMWALALPAEGKVEGVP